MKFPTISILFVLNCMELHFSQEFEKYMNNINTTTLGHTCKLKEETLLKE